MSSVETDTASSLRAHTQFNTMAGDNSLPETYHLEGGSNFGIWAYRIKNLLQRDGRFRYCITPPSEPLGEEERMARQQVMSIINTNAKNSALKLLRRYSDPYECWTGLKTRYESDSGPRRVMLIEKFFSLRKTESMTMDAHLTEVKEVTNLLEEVEVKIPEDIIVYYTLKNLPKEYEIFKRMQIAAKKLPTYEELEAKLISEETSIKMESQNQEDGEAFLLHRDRTARRFQPAFKYGQLSTNARHRRYDSGGPSTHRLSTVTDSGGASTYRSPTQNAHLDSAPRNMNHTAPNYVPRYKARATDHRQRGTHCNFCGIEGHFERECDLRSILDRIKDYEHRLLEKRNRNLNGQINNIEEPSEALSPGPEDPSADQVIDACLVELNLVEKPQHNTSWYLDSGATHHVSGDPSVFSSIYPTSGSQVRSAGGQNHCVTGVGDVDVQVLSGKIKNVPSVLYTPGITKNLLSVGSLTDQQKTLVFKSQGCFVIDDITQSIEAFAIRENKRGLYKLQAAPINDQPEVHSVHLKSQADLWHRRLGHFHTRGIQRMIASEAVRGLPPLRFSEKICNGCQLGKHVRTKLPKEATHQTSQILELVHSDVCGPFKVSSTGGARYFVTFIDDYSRKIWVYFISQKSQVLDKFRHFVQLMTTSTGQTVRALRSDNGGEYTSKAFHEFCSSKGITRELPSPYTPQRNGVAERRNRSLLDITRCLLLDRALPGHLWGEAVKAAADILNLRSTKRHPDKTPTEIFSGTKPTIAHLKVFGSSVYVHIPKPSRTKLEPRSERCILLSFDNTAKAYRCYRPSTRKVFVSRDIVIDENSPFNPIQMQELQSSTPVPTIPAPTRREESQILLDLSPPNSVPPPQTNIPNSPIFDPPLPDIPSSPPPIPIPIDTDNSPSDNLPSATVDLPSQPGSPVPDPPRRSARIRHFPKHLRDFAANVELDHSVSVPDIHPEDLTYHQVHTDPLWRAAMREEINSIHANHTWTLTDLPPHKKAISSRWVFKVKPGNPPRYKARLVARGFQQKDGIDFTDTFAPVVRWETIRILLAIATHLKWPIHQLDVLTAFLNGILEEDVYMHQPLGFIQPGAEHLVCKLHKSLYGLRQSPRAWYARLHAALLAWKLTPSHSDPNLYFAHVGHDTIALLVYVDDILITGSSISLITQLKNHLHSTFKTNDLGSIQRYLGVQFDSVSNGLHMHQTEYALSILRLFNMEDCNPSHTPLPEGLILSKETATPPVNATLYRMLVGKLLFLTKTRPDITHAVSMISRFMQNPQEAHLQAAKHVLRYLRRYPSLGLFFQQGEENYLHGYTDADYGQDIDDRISVGAYIFFLGNSPVSWNSKKQSSTSRSSCESEYRALAQCSCEAVWIRRLLQELKILENKPITLFCDNQSSIKLSYNPVFHEKSKHFEIDYHFTRQKVEDNIIRVEYIPSQEQPADLLTKPLGRTKFEDCRKRLHLRNYTVD